MRASGKIQPKGQGKGGEGKEATRIGVYHVVTTGSRKVVNTDTIVLDIIPDDNQADVQYVGPLDTIPLSAPDQSSRRRRMSSMMRTLGKKTSNGRNLHGRLKSTKLLKARKEKERSRSRKESLRARVLRDRLLQDQIKPRHLAMIDLIPAKPETRSCVADDFLFAMMSTKSKPTWRHSTWNGEDYMICTVVEPQKKLPVFKPESGLLHLDTGLLFMDMMPKA